MGKVFEDIDDELRAWLQEQPVFFVGTAPLAGDGHVNVSPKGSLGTFRVLDPHSVAYLDLTGSGIETVAHLRENGRITLMFCAFEGRPRIVRLQGAGEVVLPTAAAFEELRGGFSEHPGERCIIRVAVSRVSDSCGYAVPRMALVAERDVLDVANAKKGEAALAGYRASHNAASVDGLPGWPAGLGAVPRRGPGGSRDQAIETSG